MADKVYIDDLLLQNNLWSISQAGQTQLDTIDDNKARTHNYYEAMDFYTNKNDPQAIYAPVEMVLKLRDETSNTNRMVYQSKEPVQFANGVVDYFCIFLCHCDDNNLPTFTNNQIPKGALIYKEGVKGVAPDARHIHMQCGRGTYDNIVENAYGYNVLSTTGGDF